MGDRANIRVRQGNGDPDVIIYSHWGGTSLRSEGKLEAAMNHASGRAGDPHYFTAMLIEAISKDGLLSGVGTSLDDSNGSTLVVDAITGERLPDEDG